MNVRMMIMDVRAGNMLGISLTRTIACMAVLVGLVFASSSAAATRIVRAQNLTLAPGQTNRVLLVLEGLGNEKALGFSLAYNRDVLNFVRAVRGVDSTNAAATLFVNANQTTNSGRVGLICALDLANTNTYPAGTNSVIEVYFTPVAGVTSAVTALTYTNQPVAQEFSDPDANELPATLIGGQVTVELICSWSLNTNAVAFSESGGTGSITLTTHANCAWTVQNTNGWIAVTSATNGTGSAAVDISVDPNPGLAARSGTIVIGGQLLTVTQSGIVCTYGLTSSSQNHTVGAATNSFDVLTAGPCPWDVVNTNTWISILSGASGTGGGTVTYAVTENVLPTVRTGTLRIAGQNFTISQQAVACSYFLNPTSATHSAAAATNSLAITAGTLCPWQVTNTNGWIAILSATNGFGNGTVTYALSANVSLAPRLATLEIGGQTFSITQQAVTCSYVIAPTNRTHTDASVTDTITVTATAPCPWSAANTNTWITILSGTNGTGNGVVTYSLAANPISVERVGTILIADQPVTITQLGIACSYAVSPTRRAHGFGTASNFFTVNTGAGCLWTAVNTNPWITLINPISGNGTLAVGYTVEANPFPVERIGNIVVQGATLIITQRATTCTYVVTPTNLSLSALASTGVVSVTTGAGCGWTAATTNTWINLGAGTNGSGNGSFAWSTLANFASTARTGSVTVVGQTVVITQPGYAGGFAFRSFSINLAGGVSLSITGGPAGVWDLQVSPDLTNWSRLASLTNATGRVDFAAPILPGTNQFFRAVQP